MALTKVTYSMIQGAQANILDFGAVDGEDCSAAFQAAHDSFPSTGGAIYIPDGTFLVNAAVTFTKPIYMFGNGAVQSAISCSTASITLFTTSSYIHCYNFKIGGQYTNTLFKQLNTSTSHFGTTFRSLVVANCYRFFDSEASLVFTVDSCWIGGFVDSGIYINNGAGTSGDQGDSFITNNSFLPGGSNIAACIDVVRGAGFWVSGNKFNGASAAHLRLNVTSGNPTGNILVENNSFEGQATYAIDASGADIVTKLIVVGNQFSGGVTRHVNLDSSVWEAIVANNTFNGLTSTPTSPETAIYIGPSTIDVTVQGNNFHKIDTCITLDDAPAKILDNTFGDDIAVYTTGTIPAYSSVRSSYSRYDLSRYIENTSNSVWKNIYVISGVSVTNEIMIEGYVQGLGDLQAYFKTFNGTNVVTPIITGSGASGLDFQVLATGEIQFKIKGAVGTNVQIAARVISVGGIASVELA